MEHIINKWNTQGAHQNKQRAEWMPHDTCRFTLSSSNARGQMFFLDIAGDTHCCAISQATVTVMHQGQALLKHCSESRQIVDVAITKHVQEFENTGSTGGWPAPINFRYPANSAPLLESVRRARCRKWLRGDAQLQSCASTWRCAASKLRTGVVDRSITFELTIWFVKVDSMSPTKEIRVHSRKKSVDIDRLDSLKKELVDGWYRPSNPLVIDFRK